MKRLREYMARSRMGRGLTAAAAALLVVIALGAPNLAHAGPHGGGGSHGGGGGFHGGGSRGSMIHSAATRGGFPGSHGGGRLIYSPGVYGAYPADAYYGGYDDSEQTSISQVWYYCSDPAGYYPYVTQCSTNWQMVPAS